MATKRKDWKPAIEKVQDEGRCRHCGRIGAIDPAHIWPRSLGGSMDLNNIVPLLRECHALYDSGQLDILPCLTLEEQVQVVREAGSLARAYTQVTGTRRENSIY